MLFKVIDATINDNHLQTRVFAWLLGVNYELDCISVHERLMAEFRAALMDVGDPRSSADAISEAVSSACASSLSKDQPGLAVVSCHHPK
jgi:hypothetical protein